jgi:hypothetical protein
MFHVELGSFSTISTPATAASTGRHPSVMRCTARSTAALPLALEMATGDRRKFA